MSTPQNALQVKIQKTDLTQCNLSDINKIFDHYADQISVLSLDCFDTLIWRMTASPKDVFYELAKRPLCLSLGVTAYQRINAAARAYRLKYITHACHEITLDDIYANFTLLTTEQQKKLIEEECLTEMSLSYAHPVFVALMRKAINKGIKVIIVSDTYFSRDQLTKLLRHCLPEDAFNAIDTIFCSNEFNQSKSNGLFSQVLLSKCVAPNEVLHIGDHQMADYHAPVKLGLSAAHFIQFDNETAATLRRQHASARLQFLSNPEIDHIFSPRYSPYRGIFSQHHHITHQATSSIGYMTLGPMLYAFSRFLTDEINALERQGKKPKVFFLLRDAYLLSLATEVYAGRSLGKRVHIRKFCTVAASFRTQEDVDDYLASLTERYYDFWVICSQLLLPQELSSIIIGQANASPNPVVIFNQLIHQPVILDFVYKQSAAYRERLLKYIRNEMKVENGDTIVLVDIGYIGVTQHFLTKALQNELNVEILGRYFIASHEPNRPDVNAFITSAACDHGLFEQSCTYKEGSVLDYDQDGKPIHEAQRLSDDQYSKVKAIQDETLRFMLDAKKFFADIKMDIPYHILHSTAVAALRRHIHIPTKHEIAYYRSFQHDKDMGPTLKKTMYHLESGIQALRLGQSPVHIHPYEACASGIHTTLSSMLQRVFDLELSAEDFPIHDHSIRILNVHNHESTDAEVVLTPTHDGYYSFCAPALNNANLCIMFGEKYRWIQIENISLINQSAQQHDLNKHFILNQIEMRGKQLFECLTELSTLIITPLTNEVGTKIYRIVFRPVEMR